MAVMRLPSSVVTETGEVMTVVSENFEGFQPSFTLYDSDLPNSNVYTRVTRDNPDGNDIGLIGWGAGTKALFLMMTSDGVPTKKMTPVIALMPNADSSKSGSLAATIIESAVDPVLKYFETEKRFILYYWVNAWSPPLSSSPPPPPSNSSSPPPPPPPPPLQTKTTLFENVKPPPPVLVDDDYMMDLEYDGPQPEPRYTIVRDVPGWYKEGTSPVYPIDLDELDIIIPPMTDEEERVGPIDIDRFWIAPFTDAHLFRFPENYDPFPLPPPQEAQPPDTSGPPGPPPTLVLPPPVITDPASPFIGNFPYLSYPFNKTTRELTSSLYNITHGLTIKPSERSTLDTYVFAFQRLMGLARCSRVLMMAEGWLMGGSTRDDPDQLTSSYVPLEDDEDEEEIKKEPNTYLIVDHPKPVLALPRGINKVLLGRPKMTSFLGNDYFVTAALTYRYPAVASVSLCAGNPHVDFTIQCPSDHFDEYRREGCLPQSLTPQAAPPAVSGTIIIPDGYPTSLVEALSTGSFF